MPGHPCHVPPGRQWALDHCLPEVPGPEWDMGFSPGIRAELQRTRDCHVFTTVYVKHGPTRERIDGLDIRGYLPWGWLKVCEDIPGTPPPPPPALTLERLVDDMPSVPGRSPIAGGTPVSLKVDSDATCDIVPVPDVDVLVPWPLNDGYVPWPTGPKWTRAGGLGQVLFRIPGAEHVLFSTGYGLMFLAREFATIQGLAWMSAWNNQRSAGRVLPSDQRFNHGRESVEVWDLFGDTGFSTGPGMMNPSYSYDPHWWVRDYVASHVQPCKLNHFGREAGPLATGVVGQAIRRRWRFGGDEPAAYRGSGYDVLEEESTWYQVPGGYQLGIGAWTPPMTALYDETATRVDILPDELGPSAGIDRPPGRRVFQFRDRWEGNARVAWDLWGGDPPGAHLP